MTPMTMTNKRLTMTNSLRMMILMIRCLYYMEIDDYDHQTIIIHLL